MRFLLQLLILATAVLSCFVETTLESINGDLYEATATNGYTHLVVKDKVLVTFFDTPIYTNIRYSDFKHSYQGMAWLLADNNFITNAFDIFMDADAWKNNRDVDFVRYTIDYETEFQMMMYGTNSIFVKINKDTISFNVDVTNVLRHVMPLLYVFEPDKDKLTKEAQEVLEAVEELQATTRAVYKKVK